jgi:small GTP-binding protein
LVHRYVTGSFDPKKTTSTIGASFLTKRVLDIDSGTTVRLQIWDTAGQERFRSISKLYYRGASAVLLVYSIVDEHSFEEMGRWLMELKSNLGEDVVVHVVGTKSDVVAQDPGQRKVPFERCIAYVADNLHTAPIHPVPTIAASVALLGQSVDSKRSSGFWGQEIGWDCCHEISSKDGEGIEEVFCVITRKLVEQRNKKAAQEQGLEPGATPGERRSQGGYFDDPRADHHGSFRPGLGDKRRSWLGFPTPNIGAGEERGANGVEVNVKGQRARCC